jgi:Putative zinc-finger
MNSCERYEMLVSAWVDGELDAPEGLELTDHLVRCSACRGFYREVRSLGGLVAGLAPGSDMTAQVWDRIRAAAEREGKLLRFAPPAWALRLAAVLVIGLGVGFLLWGRGPSSVGASSAVDTRGEIQLELGEDGNRMSEARFIELTAEVLRADRRFHRAMYEVMEQVIDDTRGGETSLRETERAVENGPETENRARVARDLV